MMYKEIINKAFLFYNIDEIYKDKCFELADKINQNKKFVEYIQVLYKKLYCEEFSKVKELWKTKNISELFSVDVDPFVTNIMLLLGYQIHEDNMKKLNFDESQISIQKRRVKECFENDLKIRNYDGIRISQLLWAIYFIRGKIIEIGCLQFEYENENNIKIHIPRNTNLDILEVKKSIVDSVIKIEKVFKIKKFKYICKSWLISNQINKIMDRNTNISNFYNLFDVVDGDNCINDILNFVYNIDRCDNCHLLQENTILQRKIKQKLINGEVFYLGLGTLKFDNLK